MDALRRQIKSHLDEIAGGRPAPVYLLHGKEDFLVDRARDAIVAELQKQAGGEIEWVDGRDASLPVVLINLMEISLFSTRRIVVVRQAHHLSPGAKPDIEALEASCGVHTPEGNVLVLCGGQAFDKRTRLYKSLSSAGVVISFDALKGRGLMSWVHAAALQRELSIGKEAADALVARVGNSLRQIDHELEKLSLWISPQKEVTPDDVEAVVPRTKEDVIFDLTGAIGDRRMGDGLKFLRELRFRGATPLMILNMLGREVRFLLQAKLLGDLLGRTEWNARMGFDQFCRAVWPAVKAEKEPPRGEPRYSLLEANPYVAFLVLRRAGLFSQDELRRGLGLIGKTDLVLKSTTQSPDALLEKLLIELTLSSHRP